jgi:cytochrome d ubiquinol oxidase subunit I
MFIGDQHGLNTREHQPAKLAAIEARWDTQHSVPLTLFALPDEKDETNHLAIDVPWLGSLILTHDVNGEVKGLKDFPADQRPPVAIPFFAFRIMVGCGVLMLAIVALGDWLRWRRRLYDTSLFLRLCQWAMPIGFIAVIAGWTTTEVGRQPWTVYGLLRTAQSVSPSLTSFDIGLSLTGYMIVYLLMYPSGIFLMRRLVLLGPTPAPPATTRSKAAVPRRRSAPAPSSASRSTGNDASSRLRADLDADPWPGGVLLRPS